MEIGEIGGTGTEKNTVVQRWRDGERWRDRQDERRNGQIGVFDDDGADI